MAKKVPPFHLRTIPAAIYDELWVKNPTTNEYEDVGKAGSGGASNWDELQGKPNVIAAGDTQQEARDAIGAMAADAEMPTWATLQGKPAVVASGATQADARNAIGAKSVSDPEVNWATLQAKPAAIGAGSTKDAARDAIDALGQDQIGVPNGVAGLDNTGSVPLSQLNVSSLEFKGAWSPITNTPTLLNGEGSTGQFYKASADGTYDFGSGEHVFVEGDWVMFAAGVWQRLGSKETVASVNGKMGTVTLNAADVGALPSDYVAPVMSVNGKTGVVVLSAAEVGALPSTYTPPSVTWGSIQSKPDLQSLYAPKRTLLYNQEYTAGNTNLNEVVSLVGEYDEFEIRLIGISPSEEGGLHCHVGTSSEWRTTAYHSRTLTTGMSTPSTSTTAFTLIQPDNSNFEAYGTIRLYPDGTPCHGKVMYNGQNIYTDVSAILPRIVIERIRFFYGTYTSNHKIVKGRIKVYGIKY